MRWWIYSGERHLSKLIVTTNESLILLKEGCHYRFQEETKI